MRNTHLTCHAWRRNGMGLRLDESTRISTPGHHEVGERMAMNGAILIVDDNAADRALLRTILARAGYSVYEVAKGNDALRQAREVRPHVVILDVNLPDMSGLEVCRSIRANPETSAIPVLMLTVRHDDTDVLAGMEAGADDYVAKDAAGALILGRVRRLIEFRQMSGLAMLNQQLAQVGRLLTGIVHEIRGPLAVIRGNAELLRLTAVPGEDDEKWIDSIVRSSRILQVRLDHLMAAVRNGSSEVQVIDLSALILEAIDLFVKGLPPGNQPVRIESALDAIVPKVRVDPGRLMQVLLNLLNNGHEAIARANGTGRIVLSTGVAQAEGRSWVTINVTDDGPGVPESYIDRIFEPFFTTREEGTGYGLYLAAAILKEQSGRIMVRNNPEGGATFSIWLPEADPDAVVAGVGETQLNEAELLG
jgi:signal transduction histidine kinase